MREWRIAFGTADCIPPSDADVFYCPASGVFGGVCASDNGVSWFPARICGETVFGHPLEVLQKLKVIHQKGFVPEACILMMWMQDGQEKFLRQVAGMFPGIPFAGGCAAVVPGERAPGQVKEGAWVQMLLLHDDRYVPECIWENLHRPTGQAVSFRAAGERLLLAVRERDVDQAARVWHEDACRTMVGVNRPYEQLALATDEGWNLHLAPEGASALHAGANLPGNGVLHVRYAEAESVEARFGRFIQFLSRGDSALVFGCAGLQILMERQPVADKDVLGGFFHGEVVMAGGGPRLANLMATGLRLTRRT